MHEGKVDAFTDTRCKLAGAPNAAKIWVSRRSCRLILSMSRFTVLVGEYSAMVH